ADSTSIEARSSGRYPEAAPAPSSDPRSRSRELGQIEGQREPARNLLQLLLVHLLRPLLSLRHRRRDQILEHLYIRRIDDRRIDLYFTHTTPPVGGHRHHPTAARARHRAIPKFRLELRQPGLHLLAHLKKLLEIRHGRPKHRLLKAFPSIDARLRHPQGEDPAALRHDGTPRGRRVPASLCHKAQRERQNGTTAASPIKGARRPPRVRRAAVRPA